MPTDPSGWTLTELLVVTSLFLIASVILFVTFNRQGSFTNRSVVESLKNTLREVALREMASKTGNGSILLRGDEQGFVHIQGGQEPYRISAPLTAVSADTPGGAQTTFTFVIDTYEPAGYVPLTTTLASEGLTLVYSPEGKSEQITTSTFSQSPFTTDGIPRLFLGMKTIFYLKKENQPVSNQMAFYFYDPKNILADEENDITPLIQSGTTPVTRLTMTVNRLGNFILTDDVGTGSTTYTFQLQGAPVNLPSDIW